MTLRITTLSENTAGGDDFLGEWGLSILVETDNTNILLDTGPTISAVHNADSLGIDLSKMLIQMSLKETECRFPVFHYGH